MYGTVEITGTRKLSKDDLEQNVDKHQVEDLSQIPYEQAWAWEMTNPQKLHSPKRVCPYAHARVWVNLEYPGQVKRIRKLIDAARQVGTEAEMKDLAKMAGIVDFSKSKQPFWKLQVEDTDLNKKYMYGTDDIDSKRTSLLDALQLILTVAFHKDDVFCMQQMELKEILSEAGEPKTGKVDYLRSRVLQIKISSILGSAAKKCKTGQEPVQKLQVKEKCKTGEEPVQKLQVKETCKTGEEPVQKLQVKAKCKTVKENGTHMHGVGQKPAEASKGVEKSKGFEKPASMSCTYFETCLCNENVRNRWRNPSKLWYI